MSDDFVFEQKDSVLREKCNYDAERKPQVRYKYKGERRLVRKAVGGTLSSERKTGNYPEKTR
jgi:hypothetical protein